MNLLKEENLLIRKNLKKVMFSFYQNQVVLILKYKQEPVRLILDVIKQKLLGEKVLDQKILKIPLKVKFQVFINR